MAIDKFRDWKDEKNIEINFKCYPLDVLTIFMKMVYGLNNGELNLEEIIKVIQFIYDCDHYDENIFPWHYKSINFLLDIIESRLDMVKN